MLDISNIFCDDIAEGCFLVAVLVQMVHAALLLLMLEAAKTDLVSPSV